MSTKADLIEALTQTFKHGLNLLLEGERPNPPSEENKESQSKPTK
jgi:hypothetical protein